MFAKLGFLLAVPAALAAQQPGDNTYRTITLTEAIKLAKENYVTSVTSANSVRSAQNTLRSTRANYLPNLSFQAGQNKSAGDRLGQSGQLVPYASSWAYNTGLSAGVTLYDGGKTRADIRAREADIQAAEAGQTNAETQLILNVKRAYNAVLAANEQEAAARAALAVAQQNLAMTVARVNAGAANVADSLQQVVNVGSAQISILSAQQALRQASGDLSRYVSTSTLVTANPSDTAELSHSPIDSASIMGLALDGPNIRQQQATLTASQAARRSARAGYLPSVTTNASIGGNGTSNIYGLGGNPYPYSRSLSFRANYDIFNRYQRENQVQTAEIAIENASANLRDLKLFNQQTIITQLGILRNAEEKLRLYQISIRAAEEALRVNQARYAAGVGTLVDVLTSQSGLIGARFNLIQARVEYRNARAQIEAVIGRDIP